MHWSTITWPSPSPLQQQTSNFLLPAKPFHAASTMRCLIFPLSLLILMQAEAASYRALRALGSQTAGTHFFFAPGSPPSCMSRLPFAKPLPLPRPIPPFLPNPSSQVAQSRLGTRSSFARRD